MSRTKAKLSVLMVGGLLAATLSGCASASTPSSSNSAPTDDATATLTVWTDATRQPGFLEYQTQHPDVKLDIQTFDEAALIAKIQLFNKTGEGWPDVVFTGEPNNVTNLADAQIDYAYPLDKLISADVLAGFGNSNQGCMVNGTLYCLKNDLAQTVIWYDKELLDQFGYSIPTTWDDYAQLGEKISQEHPGYIIGAAGDSLTWNNYYWASGCPLAEVTALDTVTINVDDERCTRVSTMLDEMRANGSVASKGDFDPALIQLAADRKIVMLLGGAWYGEYLFKPAESLAVPAGRIATAEYPSWDGEDTNWAGAAGGGIYLVSKHSANQVGAGDLITWMTTDPGWTSESQTYPAYGPAADAWGTRLADDGYYVEDPFPALKAAAAKINPGPAPTRYSIFVPFDEVVTPALANGDTLTDSMVELQKRLEQLATSAGYTVTQ